LSGNATPSAVDRVRSFFQLEWFDQILALGTDKKRWEDAMPAYLIAEHSITDPERFEEYRLNVGPLIAKHGGRYLTRGGSHLVLEKYNAVWHPDRVVIIEFPDMAALNAWYTSPENKPLVALRRSSAKDMLITLDGV
jgi:uncharacterized protein (DUF1330 family)